MFCTNCGAELDDDAAFCVQCGASLKDEEASTAQSEQAEPDQVIPYCGGLPKMGGQSMSYESAMAAAQAATGQDLASQTQGDSKKRAIIIAVVAICIIGIAAIALFFGCSMQQRNDEVQQLAHQTFAVNLSIDAQGLDYATSTPVPMKISGTAFDGSTVDEEFLYDGTLASVPEMERGKYTATVIASPISGDGTMYKLAIPSTTIVVTDYETEEQLRELGHDELVGSVQADDSSTENVVAEGSAMSLTQVAPIDVTDEMLNDTCTTLENLGYSTSEVTAHRQLVETARDAARQEQLAKQTTFSDERISLKVPASWGDHWTSSCEVFHSFQSGQIPNAWRYVFKNTTNPSQSFDIVIQFNGNYGPFDSWTKISSPDNYLNYIKNNGLPASDLDAVIQSIVVKPF